MKKHRRQNGHPPSGWGSPQEALPSTPSVCSPGPVGPPLRSEGVPLPPRDPELCMSVLPGSRTPVRNVVQLPGERAGRHCLRREPQPSFTLCQQPARPRRRQTRPNTAPPPSALKGKPRRRFVARSHTLSRFPSFQQRLVFWLATLCRTLLKRFPRQRGQPRDEQGSGR